MHLTVRILGLELLHIELATETDDPDDKARDLSGGSLGSEALDVGAHAPLHGLHQRARRVMTTPTSGWEVVEAHGVHVIPLADAVDHEHSDDCVCFPRVEPVPRDDGSIGWLTVHHSLDGREAKE